MNLFKHPKELMGLYVSFFSLRKIYCNGLVLWFKIQIFGGIQDFWSIQADSSYHTNTVSTRNLVFLCVLVRMVCKILT